VESLILRSESGASAAFHSRQYEIDGWLSSYTVELTAPNFHASTSVENPGYGHPPSQLFADLAVNWAGWRGTKAWLSLEGELEIQATADSTGHITLNFKVPAYSAGPSAWSAQCAILVEAGQLEHLANESAEFFGRKDA
jgi:Family of unknown function (DUF6228)